jgi:hypothetical protein
MRAVPRCASAITERNGPDYLFDERQKLKLSFDSNHAHPTASFLRALLSDTPQD